MEQISGFILLHKPSGITSFAAIARIKKLLPRKTKVGHAGTLDLFASGLLIVGIGRKATQHLQHLLHLDKKYVAVGRLGLLTDTLDSLGQPLEDNQVSITPEQLQTAINDLGNEYLQSPPGFSALKFEGKRLSDWIRSGKMDKAEIEKILGQKARMVKLYTLKLIDFDCPNFTIQAHVSSGTYIRSLINDLAHKVGTVATTMQLERTAIGPFSLKQACHLSDLDSIDSIAQNLHAIETVLQSISADKSIQNER